MKRLLYPLSTALLSTIIFNHQGITSEINEDKNEELKYAFGYSCNLYGNFQDDMHYFPLPNKFEGEPVKSSNVIQDVNEPLMKESPYVEDSESNEDKNEELKYAFGYSCNLYGNFQDDMHYFPLPNKFEGEPVKSSNVIQDVNEPLMKESSHIEDSESNDTKSKKDLHTAVLVIQNVQQSLEQTSFEIAYTKSVGYKSLKSISACGSLVLASSKTKNHDSDTLSLSSNNSVDKNGFFYPLTAN